MAENPTPRNPTARLLEALTKAQVYRNEQQSAAVCWSRVFGIEWPAQKPEMMRLGADLIEAAQWTRVTIPAVAPYMPNMLNGFDKVEAAVGNFSVIEGTQMVSFMGSYDAIAEHSLQHCADFINAMIGEPLLEQPAIDRTLDAVRTAKSAVEDANDIDMTFKSWLLDRLLDIERALLHYNVTGFGELERSLDTAVGAFHRNPGLLVRLAQSATAQVVITSLNLLFSAVTAASIFVPPAGAPPALPAPQVQVQFGDLLQLPAGTSIEIVESATNDVESGSSEPVGE